MEMAWCSDHGLPHSALLEWDEDDRAKLAAYLIESASKCQMCGTAEWEWSEDPYAYEVIMVQCPGCYRKEVAGEDAEKQPGSRMSLIPKHRAAAMRDTPKRAPRRK
jgi:hypothetical protein